MEGSSGNRDADVLRDAAGGLLEVRDRCGIAEADVSCALGSERPAREHRRADLVMRLDSPRGWDVGQVVNVTVDVSSIYLFNADGERIDKVPY